MQKRYLKLVGRLVVGILPLVLLFEGLYYNSYLPLLTNSISFDAKILYAQKKKIEHVKVAAIGSSMALNDLNSAIIINSLTTSYFNFASWGMQMNDTEELLKAYVLKKHPKYVILASSFTDFRFEGNVASIKNYLNTPNFIRQHFQQYFYIKNFHSVIDVFRRKQMLDSYRALTDDYNNLTFDKGGAIMYNISPKNFDPKRMIDPLGFPNKHTKGQYEALQSICSLLKHDHVQLIFVQVPFNLSPENLSKTKYAREAHFSKCKKIVEQNDGTYLDLHTSKEFSSQMFVDQYHLSAAGAELFTKQVVSQIKQICPAI